MPPCDPFRLLPRRYAMNQDQTDFLESGVLELYVLGALPPAKMREVAQQVAQRPGVRDKVNQLQQDLYRFVTPEPAVAPPAWIRSALLEVWDQLESEEIAAGSTLPRILSAASTPQDYLTWSEDPSIHPPDEYDNIFFTPLHNSDRGLTVMVWMKKGAEPEIHTDCIEKFLILEGSCDITVEGEVHSLAPGDYLSVPLFKNHWVSVTSEQPCKILLQRLAA